MPRRSGGPKLVALKKSGWTQAIYYIRWSEKGRSRERTTGQTELEEAQKYFTEWLVERGRSTQFIRPRHPSEITIADILNTYATDRAPEVQDPARIGFAIDALLDWWGGANTDAVGANTCRGYAKERRAQAGTIRRELGVLRAALNHAVKEGYLAIAPSIWLPERPPPRERWLTRGEVAKLLIAARNSEKAAEYLPLFILLGVYTGARKEALLSLKWIQIDFEQGRINLNPAGRAQTKKRRPTIPISNKLFRVLSRQKATASCPYVISRNGQRLKDVKRSFRTAWQAANLSPATPHVLRHTCITWMMQKGVPAWEVGGYVGSTTQNIEQVYGHHSPDYLKRAVEAIG